MRHGETYEDLRREVTLRKTLQAAQDWERAERLRANPRAAVPSLGVRISEKLGSSKRFVR
jgi:hypothetical protein